MATSTMLASPSLTSAARPLPSSSSSLAGSGSSISQDHLLAVSPQLAAGVTVAAVPTAPPPTLNEILAAFTLKGDNDRKLLSSLLTAKTAEDDRLAAAFRYRTQALALWASSVSLRQPSPPPPATSSVATMPNVGSMPSPALSATGLAPEGTSPPPAADLPQPQQLHPSAVTVVPVPTSSYQRPPNSSSTLPPVVSYSTSPRSRSLRLPSPSSTKATSTSQLSARPISPPRLSSHPYPRPAAHHPCSSRSLNLLPHSRLPPPPPSPFTLPASEAHERKMSVIRARLQNARRRSFAEKEGLGIESGRGTTPPLGSFFSSAASASSSSKGEDDEDAELEAALTTPPPPSELVQEENGSKAGRRTTTKRAGRVAMGGLLAGGATSDQIRARRE